MTDIAIPVVPEVLTNNVEVDTIPDNENNKVITNITTDSEVLQSNTLVEGSYSLTDVEQRILFALIAGIDQNDKTLKRITVRIKDIAVSCGLTQKNAYTQIDAACDKLVTKAVIHKYKDRNGKRSSIRHPWFDELDNKETTGVITYRFHKGLTNELIELKHLNAGWVSVQQGTVIKLESAFAIRFYVLFLKWLKIGHVTLTIEQIVTLFELNGKYIDKRTKKLNKSIMLQRVVFPALERINNITNMVVGYEIQKIGKSITGVTFRFHMKEDAVKKKEIDLPSLEENKDWRKRPSVAVGCNRLYQNGFNKDLFNIILDKFDNEDDFQNAVAVALDALTSAKLNTQINNSGAFLHKKIMDYNPEQEKMFAAESAAEKQREIEKVKTRIETIASATVWENIVDIASQQLNKEDAANILKEGMKQRPELLQRYQDAYKIQYPNDTYSIDMEITRITVYGVDELKNTPKVDYSLLNQKKD